MENKQAYQDKMDAELREWQAKIDLLKVKAEKAEASQKLKYQEEIDALQTKKQQLQEKIKALRTTSEDAWSEVKSGVDKAWNDLKSAVDRARERF